MGEIVTVLGGGSFGTSIATLLAENGHNVNLWCYEQEVVNSIKNKNENSHFLPEIKLSSNIKATTNLQEAICESKWVFEAIPVKFLRNILNQSKNFFNKNQNLVVLSKGMEQDTLLFPSGIIEDVLGKDFKVSIVAGPNFAKELAQKFCTATVVCSKDEDIAKKLGNILSNSYFKAYLSDDEVGVQVGGIVKNILALIAGLVSSALGSQNTRAFLLTRGFAEMSKLVIYLGGKRETLYGLSGFGDLILSTSSLLSRNFRFGKMLGEGKSIKDASKEIGVIPEGINSVQSVYQLSKKLNLDLPICVGTYQIIFENKSFNNFLNQIMSQPLQCE